ncbi:hypothetical protein M758_6G073500 [Ceratodon purpureus]|nr:hypothetical protein M758_6G073500 [Ceratodon purpureus]
MPTARKVRDNSFPAHEVGALIHQAQGENYVAGMLHANVRTPMYKVNDSDDLHLMELISPSHELNRKLIEGRRTTTAQQHNCLSSPYKSLDNTPRMKPCKQAALKTLRRESSLLGPKLTARLLVDATAQAHPKSAATLKKLFAEVDMGRSAHTKRPNKTHILTTAEQIHQYPLNLEATKVYNSDRMTRASEQHRERMNTNENSITASGFLSERRPEKKLGLESRDENGDEQRASDLRLISKLWHQQCKSSAEIQQRLAHLLNSKYKEAFEDGRMHSMETCKHSDFKAEVAQILKNLEKAGAPQMATLGMKRALAVECVDEIVGAGMGEEYMALETCFLHPSCHSGLYSSRAVVRDSSVVKAVVRRVQRDYFDVRKITAFMLDQLCLSGPLL